MKAASTYSNGEEKNRNEVDENLLSSNLRVDSNKNEQIIIQHKANGSLAAKQLFDNTKTENSTLVLIQKSMTPEDVIQNTLQCSLGSDAERFGHNMDEAILRPLMEGRQDMRRDHQKSVQRLLSCMSEILKERFEGAHLDIYGSCLSGLSLGNSSDVDISLYSTVAQKVTSEYRNGDINRKKYRASIGGIVCAACKVLEKYRGPNHDGEQEFVKLKAVTFGKYQRVTGVYLNASNPFSHDGSLGFDITILGALQIANSLLLREYSILDPRVKMVMLSVKSWINWKGIGNASENTLSSYAWINLCIFWAQFFFFGSFFCI